jgi:hypothetical protein
LLLFNDEKLLNKGIVELFGEFMAVLFLFIDNNDEIFLLILELELILLLTLLALLFMVEGDFKNDLLVLLVLLFYKDFYDFNDLLVAELGLIKFVCLLKL